MTTIRNLGTIRASLPRDGDTSDVMPVNPTRIQCGMPKFLSDAELEVGATLGRSYGLKADGGDSWRRRKRAPPK